MTRRGTLAYYLAAWVVGCFVISLLIWVSAAQDTPLAGPARLLILYFLSLAYGAVDILLFAWVLRLVMRLWRTHNIWKWAVAGASLGAVLVALLLWLGDALTGASPLSGRRPLGYLLLAFWTAPNALRRSGIWQAPVGGATIAAVLCLVDRAFDRPADAPEAQTPAR
jgi:hypothetical protein